MTAPGNVAPVIHLPQQGGPNQAPQPMQVAPSNLLELRAAFGPHGRPLEGTEDELRGYFGAVDRLAAARRNVYSAYTENEDAIHAQNGEFHAAFTELQGITANRAAQLANDHIDHLLAAGQTLTPQEEDDIRNHFINDELSLSIVDTARAEARIAPVEVAERGNRFTRGVARALGNRWVRRAMYTAAGAGIAVGVLTGATEAVLIGGAIGGFVSPIIRRGLRHLQGRQEAHATRELRTTRGGVEANNNELLRNIETSQLGQDPAIYHEMVYDALHGHGAGARGRNQREVHEMAANRRRVGFAQTVRDIGRGIFMGAGAAGLVHGIGHLDTVPGNVHDAVVGTHHGAAGVTPDQIQHAIQSGDPNALHNVPGLENYNVTSLHQLAVEHGSGHAGHYAWNGTDNILKAGGQPHGSDAIQHFLRDGLHNTQAAHAHGVNVDIHQVVQHNGKWYYNLNVNDPNGVVEITSNGHGGFNVIPVHHGGLHGADQAEFFNGLGPNASHVMSYQEAINQLAQHAQLGGASGPAEHVFNLMGHDWVLDPLAGAAGGGMAAELTVARDLREAEEANPQRTAVALAEQSLLEDRQERVARVRQYLQRNQTRGYIGGLPQNNQLAFVRMVNRATSIPRVDAAAILQLHLNQNILNQLQQEDEDNP